MEDYNIEFAHIYADKGFGKEQLESVSRLKEVIKELKKKKRTFQTVILIDEYSPTSCTLDEQKFLEKVSAQGVNPDFVAHESDLTDIAGRIIGIIPKELLKRQRFGKREVTLLVVGGKRIGLYEDTGRYTCAMLIAAWTLVRFGVYEMPSSKKNFRGFGASQLITILPSKYEETEQKVLDILEVTKFRNLIKKVRYEFF